MKKTWSQFVEKTSIDNETKENTIIAPLSDCAVLEITGADRREFLHAQFINDLNLLTDLSAQLSAWCNPKGQVITNFIIVNTGDSYLLIFKQDLKEAVQKRLTMFILRANVIIKDISASSPVLGLARLNKLSTTISSLPTNTGDIVIQDDIIIIAHPDNSERYLMIGSIVALIKKITSLKIKLNLRSSWDRLDILAGFPWITTATKEKFLPQILNLDVLGGVNYQKGCYPGQEVIARLHYRGEIKKRLYILKSKKKLTINMSITLSNRKVGSIINASKQDEKTYYGLAVIEQDTINEKLFVDKDEVSISAPPYFL